MLGFYIPCSGVRIPPEQKPSQAQSDNGSTKPLQQYFLYAAHATTFAYV
jgi:hypothetical protein